MNLVADESIDRQIVDRLRQDGHVIHYVAEMEPGVSDDIVLQLSHEKSAVLLTADKDFGELVFRQRRLTSGVLLIRLAGVPPFQKEEIVSSAIASHVSELRQHFAVVTSTSLRIRRANE